MVRRESRDAAVVRSWFQQQTKKGKKKKREERNATSQFQTRIECCYVPSFSWMFFVDKQRENVCCKAAWKFLAHIFMKEPVLRESGPEHVRHLFQRNFITMTHENKW